MGGNHGKGEFRASIKINETFTSGRKITIIFRIAKLQYKKENGKIMGNTVTSQIWYRPKNTCAGRFLGQTHEGKTEFIILPHVCTLPPQRGKNNMQFSQVACFCH